MPIKYRLLLVVVVLLLLSPVIILPLLDERTAKITKPSSDNAEHKNAEHQIRELFDNDPRLKIGSYRDQLLEINLGANTYFATKDGQYLFAGPVFNVQSRQNITEVKKQAYRAEKIMSLQEDMYLSYPAIDEKNSITLFTDIDCGYCRQFHRQLDAINDLGITVNYIMLPRSGINSSSFDKTLSVLCSDNPQKNMTLAMQGQFNKSQQCQSTLVEQLELAHELGIQTTPSMILPDGRIKQGLVSAKQLAQLLNTQQNL